MRNLASLANDDNLFKIAMYGKERKLSRFLRFFLPNFISFVCLFMYFYTLQTHLSFQFHPLKSSKKCVCSGACFLTYICLLSSFSHRVYFNLLILILCQKNKNAATKIHLSFLSSGSQYCMFSRCALGLFANFFVLLTFNLVLSC